MYHEVSETRQYHSVYREGAAVHRRGGVGHVHVDVISARGCQSKVMYLEFDGWRDVLGGTIEIQKRAETWCRRRLRSGTRFLVYLRRQNSPSSLSVAVWCTIFI